MKGKVGPHYYYIYIYSFIYLYPHFHGISPMVRKLLLVHFYHRRLAELIFWMYICCLVADLRFSKTIWKSVDVKTFIGVWVFVRPYPPFCDNYSPGLLRFLHVLSQEFYSQETVYQSVCLFYSSHSSALEAEFHHWLIRGGSNFLCLLILWLVYR